MAGGKNDLDIELASSILYYDNEEMEKFKNVYFSLTSDGNINISSVFDSFMNYMNKIKIDDEASPEERRRKIINEMKIRNRHNPDIVSSENFEIFIEKVEITDVPLELADDIFNHLIWEEFKRNIESLDKSTLPYSEKIAARPKILKTFNDENLIYLDDIEVASKDTTSQYTTGLDELDKIVKINKTNFIVIAARPGVGKSLFMLQMAIANARNGVKSLFVSLEMGKQQLNDRIVSCFSNTNLEEEHKDEDGILDFEGYKQAVESVKNSKPFKSMSKNLQLYESKSSSADGILSKIEEFIDENKYEAIFIDYLQLLRYARMDEWASLRALTKELKNIAFRKNVLIVTGSQVSRSSTERGLYLSDLFGSSSIESDTDSVIGLENLRERRQGETAPINIKILKQREGDLAELKYIVDYSTGNLHYNE